MSGGKANLKLLVVTGAMLVATTPFLQAQHHSGGGQREVRQAPPRQERPAPRPEQNRRYENQGRPERPAYQRPPEYRAAPRPRDVPRNETYGSRPEPRYEPQGERRAVPRPPENVPRAGHTGNWLGQYRNITRDQQEHALESDPQFRKLPPQRQQQLRQRLDHFNSLQPQQQQRIVNRMDTWEHLTPQQKQTARGLYQQMQKLPPGRRDMVENAIHDLRQMPPDQRQQALGTNLQKVERLDVPQKTKKTEYLDGAPAEIAKKLVDKLRNEMRVL